MNTLIGGLLVVTLLTRPSVCKAENIAYELIYPDTQIVCVYKKDDEDEVDNNTINNLLNRIYENTREIKQLLKKQQKIVGQIQSKMDLLAYQKVRLNPEQMDCFVSFHSNYETQTAQINNAIKVIEDNKQFSEVKKEVFKTNSNMELIYNQLKNFVNYQIEAIELLKDFITMAGNTLATI